MHVRALLAVALLAAGCGGEEAPSPVPAPVPAPAPVAPSVEPEPAAVVPAPFRLHMVRAGADLLVLVVRTGRVLPAPRIPVRIVDRDGNERSVGATNPDGVALLRVPDMEDGRVVAGPEGRTTEVALPRAPQDPATQAPSPPGLAIADRTRGRPGDVVTLVLWLARERERSLEGRLVLAGDGAEDGADEIPFLPGAGHAPGWSRAQVRIPPDAPPGTAHLRWNGHDVPLEVLGRWGPPREAPVNERPATPDAGGAAARSSGDLVIEAEGEHWSVISPGPLDGRPLVLLATDGASILSHESACVEQDRAVLRLALGDRDPSGVRLLAFTADRDGFPCGELALAGARPGVSLSLEVTEGSAPDELTVQATVEGDRRIAHMALVAEPLDREDLRPFHALLGGGEALDIPRPPAGTRLVVRAAAALEGSGRVLHADAVLIPAEEAAPPAEAPAFLRPTDRWDGPGDPSPLPHTRWSVRVDLRGGEATGGEAVDALRDSGRSGISWQVLAPEEAEGPVRLTAGGVIALETRLAGESGGRLGVLDREALGPGDLEVRHAVEGFRALRLEATALESGIDDGAVDEGYTVRRSVTPPARPRETLRVEVHVEARKPEQAVLVILPLAAGTEPAEDAWVLRRRVLEAMGGVDRGAVHVQITPSKVLWWLPSVPRDGVNLDVGLRETFAGAWAWPPAQVLGQGDDAPRGRSRGERLIVRRP